MSPLEYALITIGRAVRSFHPEAMPRLSRLHYRRELAVWTLLPVAIGAVEGGLTGVIAKYIFDGVVATTTLNLVVALLTSAGAFANIFSFVWAAASHGRDKIRAAWVLQCMTLLCVGTIALAPLEHPLGFVVFTLGVVGARICWSGVVILRSTVWHANYPRDVRATLAGKLATMQSIIMAAVAYGIGQAVEFDPQLIRIVYPGVALIGGVGVFIYAQMRVRGHKVLMLAERAGVDLTARSFNPLRWAAVLRGDRSYRRYQMCMFIFGTGNLMVSAPLAIMIKDHFGLEDSESTAALIMGTIPLLMMPLTIPVWSRLLDRVHIIRFRAIHSWAFVSAIVALLIAALTVQLWLVFVAVTLQGVAFGGGVLGWNLGHHDFAPPDKVSQYMGVHVTLTGIRGMVGPTLAVAVYQALEWSGPGRGAWVFLLCLSLSLSGALGFVWLSRQTPR